jgi:uncharacterized protein
MTSPSRIDILLRLVPDNPDSVLQSLASQTPSDPNLASSRDAHGYSLLHAASSYGHLSLMRTLVHTYNVDPNITDEDGDTPLFYAESLEVARCLVDELGADYGKQNEEGHTAADKIQEDGEGEWVTGVLEYLQTKAGGSSTIANGVDPRAVNQPPVISQPGMVPQNVQIEFGTMQELPEQEVDPEFRRRIEEIASKGDLESEEVQSELRALVTDVVSDMREDSVRESQRRRVER